MAAVSAAFWLKRRVYLLKIRSEAMQQILNHMVRPNPKKLASNFSRQMAVSQMPGNTHKLNRIFMRDVDNWLRSCLNSQPPPIFKLQAISIGHGNRLRKIEQDIFALVPSQANAATMARVKIESERACRLFLRPVPGGAIG